MIYFAKDESVEHNLNFLPSPANLYTYDRWIGGSISNVFTLALVRKCNSSVLYNKTLNVPDNRFSC